ncbi:MAG TPA: glycosyltransferase family 39 protein, partial [bacterium]|nr:glycosyltransferase family 39 protein [bacterium]
MDLMRIFSISGKDGVRLVNPKDLTKALLLILFIAFALRLFLLLQPEVIHNDGTAYVRHAKEVLSENWARSKAPPFYPFLISIVQFLTGNYELAGIWISVIMGTLLVLPVFFLGKEIFNVQAGILSGLVTAVHPLLNISSGSVLTESTYHFFLATSVLFGWYAFLSGKVRTTLLFGFFTTLAYLTRPEAIGFLFIF